jgi:glutamate synthase domain-containing protein 2/ferredoxin
VKVRYEIECRPAPNRRGQIGKYQIVRGAECINCGTCVTACEYGVHERREDDPRQLAEPDSALCRNCFRCILACPVETLTMGLSPVFAALGDEYYRPEHIKSLREQATDGRIPVTGQGYKGPFAGSGYDGMWTDMSEIVRPTRDGIHGREFISTNVDLGRKRADLTDLEFSAEGHLLSGIPTTRRVPLPIVFGLLPFGPRTPNVTQALALAALHLETFATLQPEDLQPQLRPYLNHFQFRIRPAEAERHADLLAEASIVELAPGPELPEVWRRVSEHNPHLLVSALVPCSAGSAGRIVELAAEGLGMLHLAADLHGRGEDGTELRDAVAAAHRALLEAGLRDQVTLIASGGIALAEHVPKTIILGADLVALDVPLLLALECDLCRRSDQTCACGLGQIDPRWGAQRLVNLIAAWHNQLLEVLGAMGLRDVRRLRGERGRAIFAEQMEQEIFGQMFAAGASASREPPAAGAEGDGRRAVRLLELPQRPGLDGLLDLVPSRFANPLARYLIERDTDQCIDCGVCAEVCPEGVHVRVPGSNRMAVPRSSLCVGFDCAHEEGSCVNQCPMQALTIRENPQYQMLGDRRWTPELLLSTWERAETGLAAPPEERAFVGDSGGGFDRLRFVAPAGAAAKLKPEDVDLALPLNRRGAGPQRTLSVPIYGGGMSYGSVGLGTMVARAMAAREVGSLTSTGEGGYPDELVPYADVVITQVATGLFGVREETIRRAPVVEFKYAQGAKPGLGGHLLGEKNTSEVARMREAVPGTSLFSPFPFHSVYSIEDHKKHVDWVLSIHPETLISVKVSTPGDVDMVAVGSYYAGAHIVHLDGAYGGTGAAPDIAKKNIAMPIEYGIVKAHRFLSSEGIRDAITLIASGGLRSSHDILKAIALGADGAVVGTSELVALECTRCANCEKGRGCPLGIATSDPELSALLSASWGARRIVNLYRAWEAEMRAVMAALGVASVRELRGRTEVLAHLDHCRVEPSAAAPRSGKSCRRPGSAGTTHSALVPLLAVR